MKWNVFFLIRPEAAANLTGAPGYENLRGAGTLLPGARGTIVVAQVEGLPGTDSSAYTCTRATTAVRDRSHLTGPGAHWGLPGQLHPEHLGDLPVLLAKNGKAWSAVWTGRFLPSQARGHTVIVHRMPDDYRSQPAGDSGERIGCGVIW